MGERPYFEKKGSPRGPDDPYTVESVRNALFGLVRAIELKRLWGEVAMSWPPSLVFKLDFSGN
jgi:hypothetical protein